jgi:nitrogen regulatory protein PII
MAIDASNVPKILVLILHDSDAPHLERLLHEKSVRRFVLLNARGTVRSELLSVLGLSSTEKNVYLCVVPKSNITMLMTAVTERFELREPGHGIAFVLPICAMSAVLTAAVTGTDKIGVTGETDGPLGRLIGSSVDGLTSGFRRKAGRKDGFENKAANEGNEMTSDETTERFELILSIVNQGFSDELMDAARAAGAQGGTVFHARGTARPEEEKFYGISLQHEKEIVAIVARKEQRRAILDAIKETCGKGTEADGVFLALPVEQSVGVT